MRICFVPKLCSRSPPPTGKPCRVQPSCHPLLSIVEAGLKSCGAWVSVASTNNGRAKGCSDRNIHNKLSRVSIDNKIGIVSLFYPAELTSCFQSPDKSHRTCRILTCLFRFGQRSLSLAFRCPLLWGAIVIRL